MSLWDLYEHVPFDMPSTVGGDSAWEQALREKLKKITGRNQEDLKLSLESLFQSTRPETVVAEPGEGKEEERRVV